MPHEHYEILEITCWVLQAKSHNLTWAQCENMFACRWLLERPLQECQVFMPAWWEIQVSFAFLLWFPSCCGHAVVTSKSLSAAAVRPAYSVQCQREGTWACNGKSCFEAPTPLTHLGTLGELWTSQSWVPAACKCESGPRPSAFLQSDVVVMHGAQMWMHTVKCCLSGRLPRLPHYDAWPCSYPDAPRQRAV